MWARENRSLYERKVARYPSDLHDAVWALIAPLIPSAKRGGRRREVDVRLHVYGGFQVAGPRDLRQENQSKSVYRRALGMTHGPPYGIARARSRACNGHRGDSTNSRMHSVATPSAMNRISAPEAS
jgi:transposase